MARQGGSQAFTASKLVSLLRLRPFDRTAWKRSCGDHLHVRLADRRPSTRTTESLDILQRLASATSGVGLTYLESWCFGEAIVLETDLGLAGAGTGAPLPCAIVARAVDGILIDLRFYFDPQPVAGFLD